MAYIKALCDELEQNKQELESCNDSDIDKRLNLLKRQHELIEKILGFTNSEIEQYMSPSYLYQYQLQVETTIDTLSSSVTSGGAESVVEETQVETVEPEPAKSENIQSEEESKSEYDIESDVEQEKSVEQSESKENVIDTEIENNTPLFSFGGGVAGSEKEETPIESKAGENLQELITALESFASTEEIKPLIEKCADVNAKDNDDWTPLIFAARFGSTKEVVELLINNGADLTAKDNKGRTPLKCAKKYGASKEIINLLKKAEKESVKPKATVSDKY